MKIADTMLKLLLVPVTDPQWSAFFEELELSGTVVSKEPLERTLFLYTLSELGVRLYTDPNGVVFNVQFLVGPTYLNELPFGLKPGFTASEVHQLLGSPVEINQLDKVESYSFDNFHVAVSYSLEDETLELIRLFRTSDT